MSAEKIKIKQTRSGANRTRGIKDTLKALGLGRIGKERVHTVNAPLVGMIRKVEHLVVIETYNVK